MAFTVVANAHGPSPQPTAFRSPTCSLMTATGSNQAQPKVFKPTLPQKSGVDGGAIRCQKRTDKLVDFQ